MKGSELPGFLGALKAMEKCPTIYGPVNSRRHGRSLGVNLGDPEHKLCSWGCLYCQCGTGKRTDQLAGSNFPSKEQVAEELKLALLKCGDIDSVTFAGNTEPAMHPDFFDIVRSARKLRYMMRARWIINALTNGTELGNERVVHAMDLLDEAWVKLDCGIEDLWRRTNRPVDKIHSIAEHVSLIKKLKAPRIQTLLWKCERKPDIANFTPENLDALLPVFADIKPVEVHLTTVSRATAVGDLSPVTEAELEAFAERIRALGIQVKCFV